ncbi:hypothetical protein ACET3X_001855 [Alternaria dauci]|uniref:Nuclear pore complex protein n=1 Tax=Alternaria dauci TaxID=48095 RepID=A0ABR3UYI2_9PLEO
MSSSQGHSFDFRFGQSDATDAPKPGFQPKPLRARKQRGQDYDPSLTANMGPPDVQMVPEHSNTNTKQQQPRTEGQGVNHDSLRTTNFQTIKEHIEDICTLFGSTDRMSNLNATALATSWETRLWNVSFGHSDQVSAYTASIAEADKNLTKWITNWESAQEDSSDERTGRQSFVDHVQKYHTHELEYTTRTGSSNGLVSTEDKHRQVLRKLLIEELKEMKDILPTSHSLSKFDAAKVAHRWEKENWNAACEKGLNVIDHVEHTEKECEDLHLWAEYRDDYPDEDIRMTGTARFSDFIRKRLDPEDSEASSQDGDGQETHDSADESYTNDGDSDIGSEDEYEDEEQAYATKKGYLKDCVIIYLHQYTNNPDELIDRWQEKLLLQARAKGGGFDNYKQSLYNDLDSVEACRDNWDRVVEDIGCTGHKLFSELVEECSEEAIAELRRQVEEKELGHRHECLLNSDKFIESLDFQDQQRREHRLTIRNSIGDAKSLIDDSHELSDIEAIALAAHWETQFWTDGPDFNAYLLKIVEFEIDLMEWMQSWQLPLENDRTGEQNFVGYARLNPDRSVLRCELRRVLDSISSKLSSDDQLAGFSTQAVAETREGDIWVIAGESMDKQLKLVRDECTMLYRWDTHWAEVCDKDLTGEENFRRYYDQHLGTSHLHDPNPEDHGLDEKTADDLLDLAGGNDAASDDVEDDAGSSESSDEFENNDQRSVSPHSSKPHDSSDDEDANEAVESDTKNQSGEQSSDSSVPLTIPSLPLAAPQAVEQNQVTELMQIDDSTQEQDMDTTQDIPVSSNQPLVANNASISGVTAPANMYSQHQMIAPAPNHKTVHAEEGTAMDGVSYHLPSHEVEMLDDDSNSPAQKEAVDTTPAAGFATDSATSMTDTEMVGADIPQTLEVKSKQPQTSTKTTTGNSPGLFGTFAAASNNFWSAAPTFNRPALSAKKDSTPPTSIFNTQGLSFLPTTASGTTPFTFAMSNPDVPQITPQSPFPSAQTVEEQPGESLVAPTEAKSKFVSANVSRNGGEKDEKDLVAEKPKAADAKTTVSVPAVVAAPQATSVFTFKLSKGGFVPAVPSGFDAGSWNGSFDFNPPGEEDASDAVSSLGGVDSVSETTEDQKPEIDGPVDGAGADDSHDASHSAPVETDVDPTSGPEEARQGSPAAEKESSSTEIVMDLLSSQLARLDGVAEQMERIDAINAEADACEQAAALQSSVEDSEEESEEEPEETLEDCSEEIKQITLDVQACVAYWVDVNLSNNAPLAFIKIVEDLRTTAAKFTDEGDWTSPSALSKIEALAAKWQSFTDTIKALINISTYFHPDYDYRFGRSAEKYRVDIEMMSEYDILSRLPGALDRWAEEANKRRESRENMSQYMKNEILKMKSLYQDYYTALEALQASIDCEEMKRFADETLVDFHTKIVRASVEFDLQDMEVPQILSNPLECGGSVKAAQETSAHTKQRKSLPNVIADDEEW